MSASLLPMSRGAAARAATAALAAGRGAAGSPAPPPPPSIGGGGGALPGRLRLFSARSAHRPAPYRAGRARHSVAGAAATTGGGAPPRPPPRSSTAVRATGDALPSAAFSTSPPPAGPRVCVLGGGFGGLYTAVRLEDLMWPRGTRPRVTLIDKGERFVFKPLLYELLNGAASADEVAPRFDRLLASTRVAFIRGAVDRVEETPSTSAAAGGGGGGGGTVILEDGSAVEYDWLVLALGGETATFGVPGAADLATPFCTYEDAVKLNGQLTALEGRVRAAGALTPADSVVVVGAGYAGVELAATVAERLAANLRVSGAPVPPVTVVTFSDAILDGAPAGQRAAAAARLAAEGVAVRTRAAVSRVVAADGPAGAGTARRVHLRGTAGAADSREAAADGDAVLDAGLVLWTAGTGPVTRSDGAGPSLPFPRSPRGSIRVEPTLRIVGHPRAFALGDVAGVAAVDGDAAAAPSPPLPPTAQVAFQQADYAAWNVWASINARRLLAFRYQHLGDMMSLGKGAGAVTLPVPVPAGLAEAVTRSPLGGLLSAAGVRLGGGDESGGGGAASSAPITLEGPLAGALRRVAYWYRQPTGGQRVAVGREWLRAVVRGGGGGAKKGEE